MYVFTFTINLYSLTQGGSSLTPHPFAIELITEVATTLGVKVTATIYSCQSLFCSSRGSIEAKVEFGRVNRKFKCSEPRMASYGIDTWGSKATL